MKKISVVIGLILGAAAAIGGVFIWLNPNSRVVTLDIDSIELADDNAERARGLMGRTGLCDKCGMIFVFDEEAERSFWMKNTPTSLDIIFLDGSGEITAIHKNTTPNSEQSYLSNGPAMYAIEMPAGYSEDHGLRVGNSINFHALLSSVKS